MASFTQSKFLSLTVEAQHRHLAKSLRSIYDEQLPLKPYQTLCSWIGLAADFEDITDRYHYHIKQANLSLAEHELLPPVDTQDKQEPLAAKLPVSVYLDNLRSAHNVGSIMRTIEAFHLGTLYYSGTTPTPQQKKVQDTSMGAAKWISAESISDLSTLPRPLIALETSPAATLIYDFTFPEVFTLAVGNEESGLSKKTLQAADALIRIPLAGRKNSLNVANAFAIAASEICRKRRSA